MFLALKKTGKIHFGCVPPARRPSRASSTPHCECGVVRGFVPTARAESEKASNTDGIRNSQLSHRIMSVLVSCPTPLLVSETRNRFHRATCVTLTNSSPNAIEINAMVLQVKLWFPLSHLVTSDGLLCVSSESCFFDIPLFFMIWSILSAMESESRYVALCNGVILESSSCNKSSYMVLIFRVYFYAAKIQKNILDFSYN